MGGGDWTPGRVLVKLRTAGAVGAIQACYALRAADPTAPTLELDGAPTLDVPSTVAALRADPDVVYAEPDYAMRLRTTPNDEKYADQEWWLTAMQAQAAWDISTGDPDLIVAILDIGRGDQ